MGRKPGGREGNVSTPPCQPCSLVGSSALKQLPRHCRLTQRARFIGLIRRILFLQVIFPWKT